MTSKTMKVESPAPKGKAVVRSRTKAGGRNDLLQVAPQNWKEIVDEIRSA